MFVYLTRKIALANQKKIYSLCWSQKNDFIACGADNGTLKILKLDNQHIRSKKDNEITTTNHLKSDQSKFLSMNQTLDGHSNSVIHLSWNDENDKLISGDVNGLLIVWIFYNGNYYEEMVNSPSRSIIIEIKWTNDGDKICIVSEDGSVIVGSVEGQRLWSKEISKIVKLTCAEWSSDGKLLLFGLANGQVLCYDNNGNFLTKVTIFLKINQSQNHLTDAKFNYSSQNQISVVSINWYSRKMTFQSKAIKSKFKDLAIAFSHGEIHLLSNENDDDAIVIQTNLTIIKQIQWNPLGTIIAVCGQSISNQQSNDKIENCIKFYDKSGNLCYNLNVPGNELVCCCWGRLGLKIALAIDSFILFADVRPHYKWEFFADTFAFSLPRPINDYEQFNQDTQLLIFYQLNSNKMSTKQIPELLDISSKNQFCCLGTNLLNEETSTELKSTLQLCNSIGTTIDQISIDFKIKCLTMNSSRVIVTSNDSFCIWRFKTPINQQKTTNVSLESTEEFDNYDKLFNVYLSRTETKINCCCCSEKIFVIGQLNCVFLIYTLPRANLSFKLNLQNSIPKQIELNLNSEKLAVLSTNGRFNLFQLDHNNNSGKILEFNNKEVWDFRWSEDSNSVLVLNEKSKLHMFTYRDQFNAEDKVELIGSTHGYLSQVKNLVAKVIDFNDFYLDLIEKNLDFFHLNNYVEQFESDLLKTTKQLFEKGDLVEIRKFIDQNSHQTLWNLLADCGLRALNFEVAELAMIKSLNFKGIQFLKRLKKLNDKNLQRAEVFLYLLEFEEAKKIFQQTGRLDLEINMRKLFGDWESLLDLVKNELGADQTFLSTVYDELGQTYMEKQDYQQAIDCFKQSGNHELLKICLIRLEKYDEIKKLVMNSNSDLNDLQLAQYLESIDMVEQAIRIYLNCDQKEKAIDCAIRLNEWQKAIELAQEHSISSIDGLLESYAENLKTKKQDFTIVELYRKAKEYKKAIEHLSSLADKMKTENCDCLKMKKMYTIMGILYEEMRDYENDQIKRRKDEDDVSIDHKIENKQNKLNSLLDSNLILKNNKMNDRNLMMNDIWRGAEAYHFYILAQKQLFDGYYDASMKTSLLLMDYEQFIDLIKIYSLIALTSALNRNFSICSKAFIKLEQLDDDENVYKRFASEIFSKYPPKLPTNLNKIECPYCESKNYDFLSLCMNCETKFKNICIASGRLILDHNKIWICSCCKHSAIKSDLITYNNCPLCHTKIIKN